ncbi:hypothetical protein TRFO_06238 [Tritrichomonas foetus]|uniref:Ubiquitin-like domain-containing protein n=1 Tax=Tritrichomonas foetus TaxID=1144522 RepID=A0A1J4K038_9EUKA|nr:hypothetical protein TRFO_06238 [Tritrichomonas foetus]|eukprot:OHT04783.1 hypothetical protein TRFO_06238 [Tritrichomonas foetus]
MRIFVFQSTNSKIVDPVSITVSESCTIAQVKEVISSCTQIDRSDLILSYENEILDDQSTLADAQIPKGKFAKLKVSVKPPTKFVFINLLNGKGKRIKIEKTLTVKKAKLLLAKGNKTEPKYISLVEPNINADDDELLKDLKVNSEGVIDFEILPAEPKILQLEIQTSNGKIAKTRCKETATISKAKEILARSLKIPVERVALYYDHELLNDYEIVGDIEMVPGGKFFLEVIPVKSPSKKLTIKIADGKIAQSRFSDTATVGKMKEVLADTFNTSTKNISFIVDDPQANNDNSLIKDLNLAKGNVLYTEVNPIRQVTIKLSDGKMVKGSFNDAATIGKVKEVLASTFGAQPEDFKVAGFEELDNNSLLKDVHSKGTIHVDVDPLRKLTFKTSDGRIANTRFKSTATVKKAKDILAKVLNTSSDLLSFDLPESVDDETLIRDLDILFDTIYVNVKPEVKTLSFRTDDGKVAKARYAPKATIGKAKEMLAESLNTTPDKLNVHIDGEIVDDEQVLGDINLPSGKVLELSKTIGSMIESDSEEEEDEEIGVPIEEPEFQTLKIVTSTGNVARSRFKSNVTAKKVKEVMANILETTPECISLSFENQALEDDILVRDLHIQNDQYIFCQKTPKKRNAIQNLCLQLEDGTKVKSKFRANTNVRKVKEVLSSMMKVPTSRLILSYKGNLLQDSMLISNLNITDDRFIFVQRRNVE